MMDKIYRKGNYIIYIDSTDRIFRGSINDVKIILNKDNTEFDIYGLRIFNDINNYNNQGKKRISLENLVKEDNSPYTFNEFEDFYTLNTGFNLGSAIGPQTSGITSIDSVTVNSNGILSILYTDFNNTQQSVSTVKSVLDIKYNVQNYNELLTITTQNLFDYAYVREEQGTSWLPGLFGGTYYGSGLYMWNGVNWVEDDTEVFNELNNILTTLPNKADKKITEINVKNINELLLIHPANLNNEIQLDNAVYKIDSTDFNMSGYTLVGHVDGTTIAGYSQNINCLKSNEDNISLIKTNGNLFIKHLEIQVTGTNSEVLNMSGSTGFETLDMFYASFINCNKLGTLTGIRQAFWEAGFAINFNEGFLLQNDWLGGFTIRNTRVVNVNSYLLRGDTNFTCSSIRSNVNASLLTNSVAFDFDYNMFNNDSAYQLEGGRYDGTGKMVSNFTTGDTTITRNSRKSFFKNNKGNLGENTYIGIEWITTTQIETNLDFNTLTKIDGITTYSNEVNFISSGNNTIVYNSNITQLFNIQGNIYLLGGANDIVDLYIRKWNNITSSYEDIQIIRRLIINSQAGEDVAEFNFFTSTELSFGDRIELWVINLTDNSNVTMINTSKLKISEP